MKKSMKGKCNRVVERFPDAHFDIAQLMRKNPGFLSLCQDYSACVDALEYWSKSTEPEASKRIPEYRAFVRELEKEILQALEGEGVILPFF